MTRRDFLSNLAGKREAGVADLAYDGSCKVHAVPHSLPNVIQLQAIVSFSWRDKAFVLSQNVITQSTKSSRGISLSCFCLFLQATAQTNWLGIRFQGGGQGLGVTGLVWREGGKDR